jgi:hypothetical protein
MNSLTNETSALKTPEHNPRSPLLYRLLGLFIGVWVDRLPRRPIMLAADLGRALLLMLIPLAGAVSEMIGIRLTLLIGSSGLFLACAWLLFSPLRRSR